MGHRQEVRMPVLVAVVETLLGLVLAVTPVALWIAWEPGILFAVLGAALASAVLLVLLHRLAAARDQPQAWRRPELGEHFYAEMHRIFPLVHHHSRGESARFRGAMQRVRRQLR
jgi:hypothetical protein